MKLKVTRIDEDSPFQGKISEGDVILAINGKEMADVLDVTYEEAFSKIRLTLDKNPPVTVTVHKGDRPFGLEFAEECYLTPRWCRNNCVFCFVHQLPKGMRKSLYVRDDDWRLSFVSGNYVTLTNLSEKDFTRIIEKKFSPLYLSVHATDDAVRRKMLGYNYPNPFLADVKRLADAGIRMHTQIVLCPGWNDGEVLEQTLKDLYAFYPSVLSVAVVPVGLTGHRQSLTPLQPVQKADARDVIRRVDAFAKQAFEQCGDCFVSCSDEFYIKAELPFPEAERYGDFSQLENGVGMAAKFSEEFTEALTDALQPKKDSFTLITGTSAAQFLNERIRQAKERFPALDAEVVAVENEFFGKSITVAGLLTGKDIVKQCSNLALKQTVLLPKCMLREFDDVLLDNMSVAELSQKLNRKIVVTETDGFDLAEKLFEVRK